MTPESAARENIDKLLFVLPRPISMRAVAWRSGSFRNPPFGKKSSTTTVGEEGKVSKERDNVERGDFWTTTSNKQLNFVQHVKTLLKQNGRAALVLPDNVLFEDGAGETIRRKLLHECDVH